MRCGFGILMVVFAIDFDLKQNHRGAAMIFWLQGQTLRFKPAAPASAKLEQAIDERRHCRTFGQYQQPAKNQQKDNDRKQPPFLAHAQKLAKFFDNSELTHSNSVQIECRHHRLRPASSKGLLKAGAAIDIRAPIWLNARSLFCGLSSTG
jgi:hypothetical protein